MGDLLASASGSGEAVCRALGFDPTTERIRKVVLTFEVGDIVTADVTRLVFEREVHEVVEVLKRYRVVDDGSDSQT